MKRILSTFILLIGLNTVYGQSTIEGNVKDANNKPVPFASVYLKETRVGDEANNNGVFKISNVANAKYTLVASAVGYKKMEKEIVVNGDVSSFVFNLVNDTELEEVELYGSRTRRADKLETLTRIPLAPNEQLQSISILSDKLIKQQNALSLSDVTKNVAGVYTFATYGNTKESMSLRGYRGIPLLKNGVRVNSDFRGTGILTDMAGVDNIQVLKGISAISQGLGGDLGSVGGVINVVTKTPHFKEGGELSIRTGSYGRIRPTFDFYGPLNENNTVAYRVAGSYDRADSYRAKVNSERFYINPSLAWRPNDKTTIYLEMDYMDDGRTPDQGTVNLGDYSTNDIFKLHDDKFMGFESDRASTENTTYSLRFDRELTNNLSVKAGYFVSDLNTYTETSYAFQGSSRNGLSVLSNSQRYREYYASGREDKNSVLQIDLVGKDVNTGSIKHTFQVGVDYRTSEFENLGYSSNYPTDNPFIDVIDLTQNINNTLPSGVSISRNRDRDSGSKTKAYGFTVQDKVTVASWADLFLGLRYSSIERTKGNFIGRALVGSKRDDALNPLLGFNVKPKENIIVFGSYASSSDPRSSFYTDINGNELGTERWDQYETGVKSTWFDNALRFNVTLFSTTSKNLNLEAIDAVGTSLGYYLKGGEDTRKGVELEVIGRVLPNLEVIAGYSYLDAKFKEHNYYYYNSSPINTPNHTANVWVNYAFKNKLKGLSIGTGAYYLGKRPHNVWAKSFTHTGVVPGEKPFDLKAYTTVNIQASYTFNNHFMIDVFGNNIFDELGYNAYRTVYLNRIEPATVGTTLRYKF